MGNEGSYPESLRRLVTDPRSSGLKSGSLLIFNIFSLGQTVFFYKSGAEP